MAIDKSRLNPARFVIKFNNTEFRDIDEFCMDMKNIFAQMAKYYNDYRQAKKIIIDKAEVLKLKEAMLEKEKALQNELQEKLEYITDSKLVDDSLVGDVRCRLVQLKSLNGHTNLEIQTDVCIAKLIDLFNNRVLDSKLAVFKKIISHRKTNIN